MKRHNKPIKKTNFRIDEVIIVIIVAVLAIAVSIYYKINNLSNIDAEKITSMLINDHEIGFASNGIIDNDKFMKIREMNYYELKEKMGIRGDFCMYIEDEDGNIILAKGSARFESDAAVCAD